MDIEQKIRGVRRSRNDQQGRDFRCGCGKSYLSRRALYSHIKMKHNGQMAEGTSDQTNISAKKDIEGSSVSYEKLSIIKEQAHHPRNGEVDIVQMNQYDAAKVFLNKKLSKQMAISDKLEIVPNEFEDTPKIIHENYLKSCPQRRLSYRQFGNIVKATESLVQADVLGKGLKKIEDSLLRESKIFLGCVYPCEMASESLEDLVRPKWQAKKKKIAQNIKSIKVLKGCIGTEEPVNFSSVKYHYAPMIYHRICGMLQVDHPNYDDIVVVMKHYNITPQFLSQKLSKLQFGAQINRFRMISSLKKSNLQKAFLSVRYKMKTDKTPQNMTDGIAYQ